MYQVFFRAIKKKNVPPPLWIIKINKCNPSHMGYCYDPSKTGIFAGSVVARVCTTRQCSWCCLVASDAGWCAKARYSTVPFAYWCCGARNILFVFFHADSFWSLPCDDGQNFRKMSQCENIIIIVFAPNNCILQLCQSLRLYQPSYFTLLMINVPCTNHWVAGDVVVGDMCCCAKRTSHVAGRRRATDPSTQARTRGKQNKNM